MTFSKAPSTSSETLNLRIKKTYKTVTIKPLINIFTKALPIFGKKSKYTEGVKKAISQANTPKATTHNIRTSKGCIFIFLLIKNKRHTLTRDIEISVAKAEPSMPMMGMSTKFNTIFKTAIVTKERKLKR